MAVETSTSRQQYFSLPFKLLSQPKTDRVKRVLIKPRKVEQSSADLISLHQRIIRWYPILTPPQEVIAFEYYQDELTYSISDPDLISTGTTPLTFMQTDEHFISQIQNTQDNNPEKFDNLFRDSQTVKQAIWLCNVRLVEAFAKKFIGRGLDYEDELIVEGYLGLSRAIEKFDLKRGYKFSTYATWWVRQEINRAVQKHARSVRIPLHIQDTIALYYKLANEFEKNNWRKPTTEESRRLLIDRGVTEGKVEKVLNALGFSVISLDRPVSDKSNQTLGDLVASQQNKIDQIVDSLAYHQIINTLMGCLSDDERFVIEFRLASGGDIDIKQVMQTLSLSRSRIFRIEACAHQKMRCYAKFLGISADLV